MVKGKKASLKRKAAYRKLLRTADEVLGMARSCRAELDSMRAGGGFDIELDAFIDALEHFIPLTEKVIDQCRRRVIDGENVPASEKVVSIFEDHTDIIRRGKSSSPTEFGHKVLFSASGAGLITQYKVCEGNPGDDGLLKDILDKHVEQFGYGPARFAGDRRFYSSVNEQLAASDPYNVEYVSIPKPGRRSDDRRRHEGERWFKLLQRFRAGIEGVISVLMRALGCTRCLWRGLESFGCYIGLSVFAFNLRKIAFVT